MSHAELTTRLELARRAGREAGRLTLAYFNRDNYQVEVKADDSPVTVADRQAEQLLRERILAAFPDDAILGEEFGPAEGSTGFRWILDPIDGTKSFIHGVPLYGTMVGVEFGSECLIGLVYVAGLDEMVYAAKGEGAWYERGGAPAVRARVSSRAQLTEATFLTTEVRTFGVNERREAYRQLEAACRLTRTWGDCYGYLLVAVGRADVMIDPVMNVWDAAALQPILEESGGTFTDWQGQRTIHSGEGVATNRLLLEQVLAITRRFPRHG